MFDEGQWTVATTFGTEAEASLAEGFLESHGIASRVESRAFRQEPVNFGSLAVVRLWVAPAELDRARQLIEERHRFTLLAQEEDDDVTAVEPSMDEADLRRENA
jgi:hypothetical protein